MRTPKASGKADRGPSLLNRHNEISRVHRQVRCTSPPRSLSAESSGEEARTGEAEMGISLKVFSRAKRSVSIFNELEVKTD